MDVEPAQPEPLVGGPEGPRHTLLGPPPHRAARGPRTTWRRNGRRGRDASSVEERADASSVAAASHTAQHPAHRATGGPATRRAVADEKVSTRARAGSERGRGARR